MGVIPVFTLCVFHGVKIRDDAVFTRHDLLSEKKITRRLPIVILRFTLGYALLFVVTAFTNRYDQWLPLPPASIHQWRQADGAAIAGHYAQDTNFWEVKVCNLFYTGSANAVGELPLLYWASGLITHYWGGPAYPLRWIGLLLLFFGAWAFGWIILQLAKRPAVAVLGSGLLLSSPILAYYGPGFLPDAPAFCFVLMMMACLFRADQRQSRRWLAAAGMAAVLAILLKLSMAIIPLAVALAWGLGKWQRRWPPASIWNSLWPLALITGVALAVLGFRGWIAQYNTVHHATYFLSTTRPIWRYDFPFIRDSIVLAGRMGLPVYASAGLYLACAGGLWLSLKYWKATPFAGRTTLALTALGSAAYVLLWFRMFREHDYYMIALLAIPALLLLNGLRIYLPRFAEKHLVYALSLFLLLGIWHTHVILSRRLHLAFHPQTSRNLPPDAFLSTDRLTEAGINLSTRVLCPEDPSPNIALLALQRQGWTAYNFGARITTDTLYKYHTNFGLTHLALRDTALYSPLYRQFFPVRVADIAGWHLYAH